FSGPAHVKGSYMTRERTSTPACRPRPPEQSPDVLFERAQLAEDAGDICRSQAPLSCFNEMRSYGCGATVQSWEHAANGSKIEAEAALRAATCADPTFAEAWYNLSDLLDEQGRSEAAIDCLRRALQAAPDYADAMFNLALLLQRGSRHKEAADCW